jgi:IS30 family transposase
VPGRRLEFAERTEIRRRLSLGQSFETIGVSLARPRSTIWREVERNGGAASYDPWAAQTRAGTQARRPKVFKLERHARLRRVVEAKLWAKWSPDQIEGWLRREVPDDPRWWVSAQTIYESLYVQGRGVLRAGLEENLRRHRSTRRKAENSNQVKYDSLRIALRPPEADDRRVPGYWEGDLLMGKRQESLIGVLVERTSRYVVLVALENKSSDHVIERLTERIVELPAHLRRSLTWDRGQELARHVDLSVAAGLQIYFCDPGKPWQKGTVENTNGLLRQYFPKGEFDFRSVIQDDLEGVAHELNNRPRKTLGYASPAETYADLVAMTP